MYLDTLKVFKQNFHLFNLQGEPFYVGKGHGNRDIFIKGKNKHVQNKCKSLKENFKIHRIDCKSETEALELEKRLIKILGRKDLNEGSLLNLTNGGEGTCGYSHTEDAKAKIALASSLLHRRISKSKEHREKISQYQKGKSYEEKMGAETAKRLKEEKRKSYEERFGEEKAKKIKEKQSKALLGKSRPRELMMKIAEKKKIKMTDKELNLLRELILKHGNLNKEIRSYFKKYRYYVIVRIVKEIISHDDHLFNSSV